MVSHSVQDFSLRQFLLTNLIGNSNGSSFSPGSPGNDVRGESLVRWRFNLEAIAAGIQSLKDFPNFVSTYEKPTLFIGGAESNYIT